MSVLTDFPALQQPLVAVISTSSAWFAYLQRCRVASSELSSRKLPNFLDRQQQVQFPHNSQHICLQFRVCLFAVCSSFTQFLSAGRHHHTAEGIDSNHLLGKDAGEFVCWQAVGCVTSTS